MWTDLGWSGRETTINKIVWLTGLRDQPSHSQQQQRDKRTNIYFFKYISVQRPKTKTYIGHKNPARKQQRYKNGISKNLLNTPEQAVLLRPRSEIKFKDWMSPSSYQTGRESGPCRLWGLDNIRHMVPTPCSSEYNARKGLYMTVHGLTPIPLA